MPPRGLKSAKRERQYEHIKESVEKRGVGTDRAEEIAARTVNKQRSEAGETKAARKRTPKKSAAKKSTAKTSAARSTASKRAATGRAAKKTTRKVASKKR